MASDSRLCSAENDLRSAENDFRSDDDASMDLKAESVDASAAFKVDDS